MRYLSLYEDFSELKFNINDYVKHKNDNQIYKILTMQYGKGFTNHIRKHSYMLVGPIFCNASDVLYFGANDNDLIPITEEELKEINTRIDADKYNL